jgi:N-acetylglucosamine-6-phosphate deacetylase
VAADTSVELEAGGLAWCDAHHADGSSAMSDIQRLRADHVVTPDGVLHDAEIEISGDRLVSAGPSDTPAGTEAERVAGWVVPGFVDIHVHGGDGCDYATEDPQLAIDARAFHAAHGTTSSLASLITAPVDVLCRQILTIADLVDGGYFAGVHLEGPFLSPDQRGAHERSLLRLPDPETVDRLIAAGRGHLTVVTLAPELPGAMAVIPRFLDAGVRVAVGHTDADRNAVAAALDAGATVTTHLFNAMRSIHHRKPGPVPLLLTDARVAVELIADRFHLHRDVLRMAAAAAGPDRVLLITDAMAAAGKPDGKFTLGGREVRVRDGMARLVGEDGSLGPIAGSTLTMAEAFQTMSDITGSIEVAAGMAATNAARHLGLAGVGRIEPGCRADLCVVDENGALQRVMQAGRWLPAAGP